MAIILQKQTLVTVNFLKVVEIVLSKIWNFYHAPAPFPSSGWFVQQNTFFFSLTFPPISSQYFVYIETKWLVSTLDNVPKVSSLPNFFSHKTTENGKYRFYKQTSYWSFDQRVMFGSLLHLVSTLPSVVLIHHLQVKICILFVTWPHKTNPVRCHAYLRVTAPYSMSTPWRVW